MKTDASETATKSQKSVINVDGQDQYVTYNFQDSKEYQNNFMDEQFRESETVNDDKKTQNVSTEESLASAMWKKKMRKEIVSQP